MRVVFLCLSLFAALSCNAALIDDGNITRDTRTGLEWLDLTETTNISWVELNFEYLFAGKPLEGWRVASQAEVQSLFDSAGSNARTATPKLSQLWGITYPDYSDGPRSSFYIDLEHTQSTQRTGYFVDGELRIDRRMSANHTYFSKVNASPYIATALVRDTVVPVPAAIWLFSSALAGLGWMRRKRVA